MKISFNKLNPQNTKEKLAVLSAMQRVYESGYYILGPEVKNLEDTFANYTNTKYGIGVANGLEALQISLMALGIGRGDEVITTPLSAVATALAIKSVGAEVIFVDIDQYNCIDASKIEENLTSRTKAIIPVHIYGQSCNIGSVMGIAKKHNVHVIEDCAQAVGATFNGQKVGSFGTFGCFSFYPTKNLGGIGDGGMITTNDAVLAEKCRMIRNYGQSNRYEHKVYGINSRLDELQAAILAEKMKYLDNNNARRSELASIYTKELSSNTSAKPLKIRKGSNHIYHLYVIETEQRDALQTFLKDKGIETLIHYPIPVHKQACFKEYNQLNLPLVEERVSKILSLPMHQYLTDEEVMYVCDAIKSFYEK